MRPKGSRSTSVASSWLTSLIYKREAPRRETITDVETLRQPQRLELPDVRLERQLLQPDEATEVAGAPAWILTNDLEGSPRPRTFCRVGIETLQPLPNLASLIVGEGVRLAQHHTRIGAQHSELDAIDLSFVPRLQFGDELVT